MMTKKYYDKWIKQESKKYTSKSAFYASDIYREKYPQIKKAYDLYHKEYVLACEKAMKTVNQIPGDKVEYSIANPFGEILEIIGYIKMINGIAYVIDDNNKRHKWHKGYIKTNDNNKI